MKMHSGTFTDQTLPVDGGTLIRSLVVISLFLLSSETWSQTLPVSIAKNISCNIAPSIAKNWVKDEIKIYFNNDIALLNEAERYFDRSSKAEIDRRCVEFVNDTIGRALTRIQTINPALVAETIKRHFSKLQISFVHFCHSNGRPLVAAACFKNHYFFSPHEIQISSFSSGLALEMFFPNEKYRIQNKTHTNALIHEFLHYFGWDNLSKDQHDNPFAFETVDAIYSCTNVALPNQPRLFGKIDDREVILEKQEDVCRRAVISPPNWSSPIEERDSTRPDILY
ncbi:MAG: hypothetical protein J0L82_09795 [Deltaproteobacteria bacterium]|jgi:hypothetical protein|nr:hypothetical protein [Deltaproteobacteria bacterium]